MKILNFGSCNIDSVYTLSHIVRPGETLSVDAFEQFVGGKGLNQSVALANAGVKVYHAGLIGDDGSMLRASITVPRKGAAPSIPLREEVQKVLENA